MDFSLGPRATRFRSEVKAFLADLALPPGDDPID